ncbi:uncharacterized protein LOC117593658 [Esox lucius]|uniref:uncharacterized protein LOC117593658 n=1 Tax=Esox lucius TaxID=8010 RepID=UPI001476F346|nr:uncharacterized protein LOC117593658 [Esox lucius]
MSRMQRCETPTNMKLTLHFLTFYWLIFTFTPGMCYFLGDSKAVLSGCAEHWMLQDGVVLPFLYKMTACVHVRVVVPGDWIAFQYSSVFAPKPELGLEGDKDAVYAWLLGVRHRFPLSLTPTYWHQLCLHREVLHNSFSLEIDGDIVAERTVIAKVITTTGLLS